MSDPRLRIVVDTDAGLRLAATERAARIDALSPNRTHLMGGPPPKLSAEAAEAEERLIPLREDATLYERAEAIRAFIVAPVIAKGSHG